MFIFIRFSFTFFKINLRKLKKYIFFILKIGILFIYLVITLKLKKKLNLKNR
jgi:hypothetical protein